MGIVSTKQVSKSFIYTDDLFFRSDSRHYHVLFEFGFYPRSHLYENYSRNKKRIVEPTLRKNFVGPISDPYDYDFDPDTAICASKNFDAALLFPVPESGDYECRTWIYFIRCKSVFLTYKNQKDFHAKNFVMEVACRDIPAGDIIAAIQCERYISLDKNAIYYRFISDLKWNPKAIGLNITNGTLRHQDIILQIVNERANKLVQCPLFEEDYPFQDSIDNIITSNDICSLGKYLMSIPNDVCKIKLLTPWLLKAVAESKFTIAKLLLLNGAEQSILSTDDKNKIEFFKNERSIIIQPKIGFFKKSLIKMSTFKPRSLVANHIINQMYANKDSLVKQVEIKACKKVNTGRISYNNTRFFDHHSSGLEKTISDKEMANSIFGHGSNKAKKY
ncbi:TPA: hypothetical protein RJD83_002645 [Legionella pneumophila]|nr:hypothetical protein [Legionella pneumophila]